MKLLVFASLVAYASGFAINIDAHDTECFFDVVKAGTKMGLTFQVAEGGFLDIDVTVPCYVSSRRLTLCCRSVGQTKE